MRARHLLKALLVLVAVTGCRLSQIPAESESIRVWEISDDLRVEEIAPGIWMHTSWRVLDSGYRFPSNSLVVRDGNVLYLIDTAWGVELTEQLLAWIDEELALPIEKAIITHFHDDRMGGTSALSERGIPFVGHPLTQTLGASESVPLPEPLGDLQIGDAVTVGPFEVFYPGPGHTEDNLFAWIPDAHTLFGGCAVRPANSRGLGNTADADVGSWPEAIRRTQTRYPNARVVIPSHGEPGDVSLLNHTLSLFEGHSN